MADRLQKLNSFGGKLFYRFISIFFLLLGVGISYFAIKAWQAESPIAAIVFGLLALLMFWLVKRCWRSDLTLDDIGP